MSPPPTAFSSRAWLALASVLVALPLALVVALAVAAGCSVDVPLGVDPRSDAAVPASAADAGGG
jgi:hypothetical protein